MKKTAFIFISISLMVMFLSFSSAVADPSSLIVVRASDSSLWKSTCTGSACSGFTSFPGLFSSQPTVFWDESIPAWVVVGRASDGSIWRSTFNRLGTFNNDWASIPGSTPSPPGAAGGGVVSTFNSINGNMTPVTLTGTVSNIKSISVTAPLDGFFVCTGTGTIQHSRASSSGNDFSRVYMTDVSGGTETSWNFTDVPGGTPAGITSFPFSVQRWFSVLAGSHTYYLTGEAGGGASGTTTTTAINGTLTCEYYPYAF